MDSTSAPPQPAAVTKNVPSGADPAARVPTASIVATLLQVSKQVSDLIFSPSRAPQIELNGQLREVNITGVGKLTPKATHQKMSSQSGHFQRGTTTGLGTQGAGRARPGGQSVARKPAD